MDNPKKVNDHSEVFIELQDDEHVLWLREKPGDLFRSDWMFKITRFFRSIHCKLLGISWDDWDEERYQERKQWIDEGVKCELLELGSPAWKKGKVKIKLTLEFYPDESETIEPESPLDEIRKTINL